MLWAERAASKRVHDEIRRHGHGARTCSHSTWRARGSCRVEVSERELEGKGRKHSGMKGPLCFSTQYGPRQPRGAHGRAVELDGGVHFRARVPSEEEVRQAQILKG